MKNLFNKSLNDYLYFFTPPIIYQFLSKTLAKKHIKNNPETDKMKLSLDSFRKEKFNYFFDDSVIDNFCDFMEQNFINMPSLPTKNKDNQKYLNEIEEKGYTVISNLYEKSDINNWLNTLNPIIDKHVNLLNTYRQEGDKLLISDTVTHTENGLKIIHNIFDGVIRMWNIKELIPQISTMVESNAIITDVCSSYLGNKTTKPTSYLDVKSIEGSLDSSVQLHSDSSFKILKVFIPLEDVTLNNAPFMYFEGTHKFQDFRLFKDFLEFTQQNKKYYDMYSSYGHIGMFKLSEKYPELKIKPKTVTVKAGEIIIANTNGIHGASNLVKGRRIQLGLVYGTRGFDIGNIPFNVLSKSSNSIADK